MKVDVSAVLFDLDGTLVDTKKDLTKAVNHALSQVGGSQKTIEEIQSFIGDGVVELLRRSLGSSEEERLQKAVSLFRSFYLQHCADFSELYPGVINTLNRFGSKPMGIVTNKPEEPTRALLKALQVDLFFQETIGGDTLPVRKPSPEPLLKAAENLKVNPKQVLMVGDSPGDIQAGKAAGMKTCAVSYGYRSSSELEANNPDCVIHGITEIFDFFI